MNEQLGVKAILQAPNVILEIVYQYCVRAKKRAIEKIQNLYFALHEMIYPIQFIEYEGTLSPLGFVIKGVNPKVVLELGTGGGEVTREICRLSEAKVLAVNPLPHQDGDHSTLSKLEMGGDCGRNGFGGRVQQIYSQIRDFEPNQYFKEPLVDLAIIRVGGGNGETIRALYKAINTLRPGATVLLDGSGRESVENKLLLAWMKLRRKGFCIERIKGTQWGIWRYNP